MKNPVGTVCVGLGALLGILGLFLPFAHYSEALTTVIGHDSDNVFRGITIIWIAAAILALIFTFTKIKIATLLCSLVAGGGFLLSFFVNSGDLSKLGEDASKGIGYWLLLIGAIVMILAGLIAFITTKKEDA